MAHGLPHFHFVEAHRVSVSMRETRITVRITLSQALLSIFVMCALEIVLQLVRTSKSLSCGNISRVGACGMTIVCGGSCNPLGVYSVINSSAISVLFNFDSSWTNFRLLVVEQLLFCCHIQYGLEIKEVSIEAEVYPQDRLSLHYLSRNWNTW